MEIWQSYILIVLAFIGMYLGTRGLYESSIRKNAFGQVHTGPLGMYVWGDCVVIGPFWVLVALICLAFKDFSLFMLIFCLFWMVRSIGETIYWLNEQHSTQKRVNIKQKFLYKYFHNDSILFIYQITHQCITVIAIVASLYFAKMWLEQF
jgi:hypothetical protein